jgi:hypothetical protein
MSARTSLPALGFLLFGCPHPAEPELVFPGWEPPVVLPRDTLPHGLSDQVAAQLRKYPTDGSHGYYWPADDGVWMGTTREVWYQGQRLSTADPQGRSHCVGLTWEVAMAVLQEAAGDGPINGLSLEEQSGFRLDWFVRNLGGAGAAEALERYGLGQLIPLEEARRGDMLQIWALAMGGHSAIFDRWVRQGGVVVGIRYWSTHPATRGIGYIEERFTPWGMEPERIFVGRLSSPSEWRPPEGRRAP